MNEAWFSAQLAPYLSLLSLFSLLSYCQVWADKGKHKSAVMAAYWGVTALGVVLACLGALGFALGQPQWVWGSLMLSGLLLAGLMGWATVKIGHTYAEAELRRTIASDL